MNKIAFSWIILVLYLFLIFYFSSFEKVELIDKMPEFYLRDKALHIVEYGILGFLSYNAFRNHDFLNKKILFYSVMFAFVYGITDEVHQLLVPGRTFSFVDIFANFIGSCLIYTKRLL